MKLKELASALGVSTKTIRRWVKSGCPSTRKGSGRTAPLIFDQAAVVEWMERVGRDGLPGGDGSSREEIPDVEDLPGPLPAPAPAFSALPGTENLNRLIKVVKVKVQQLEVKKRERLERVATGEMVNRDEVLRLHGQMATRIRARMMAIPGVLSGILASLTDPREVEEELDRSVRAALEELSKDPL